MGSFSFLPSFCTCTMTGSVGAADSVHEDAHIALTSKHGENARDARLCHGLLGSNVPAQLLHLRHGHHWAYGLQRIPLLPVQEASPN